MDEKIAIMKKDSPDVEYMTIVCDFTNMSKISDYDYVFNNLEGIDIGMLILNAGWGDAFHGHLIPDDWVTRMTVMNVAQIPYLTTKLLPLIKARHHGKSAIVIVSSVAGLVEGPYGQHYNGSKRYVLQFARCLHEEYKGKGIDVLSYNPGFVETDLIKDVP